MTITEQAWYEIGLKDAFTAGLKKMEGAMNHFESKLGGMKSTMAGVFGGTLLANAAQNLVGFLKDTAIEIVSLGAEMEQTNVAFEVLIGNTKLAQQTVAALKHFADVTPFSTNEVVNSGKQLLAYQFQTQELIPTLTTLGDVASGLKIPMGDLIYLYGTLKSQGTAMTKDITQFATRGIPIWKVLQDQFKTTEDGIKKMVSTGQVKFKDIEKAFKTMTAAGGQFGGMMEKQSQTLAGKWSTFTSKIENMKTNIGLNLTDPLGKAIDKATEFIDLFLSANWNAFLDQWRILGQELAIVGGLFVDLWNSIFGGYTAMDKMQFFAQYVAFAFRAATTGLRMLISAFEILFVIVNKGWPILAEFGKLAANTLAGDFGAAAINMANLADLTEQFIGNLDYESNRIRGREREGWAKIFQMPEQAKETDPYGLNNLGGAGGAGGKTTGTGGDLDKSKGAGVEKISAGTRNMTINIATIKLADSIISNKADMSDVRIREQLQRALLTAVNDVNVMSQ